jgi:tetratricopeptide (TPR) repeat protein
MANNFRCLVLKILVLLILQGVSGTIAAQPQRKIDSLRSLLPGNTDRKRADIFYELAYEYVDFNDTLGAMHAEASFQFAQKANDSLRMVKAARIKATALRRLEKLDSAIMLGLGMLPIATRNRYNMEVKQILRGVAVASIFKGNLDLALRYNFELLKTTECDNDSIEMRLALSNIGLIYYKLAHHEKSLQYYYRALGIKSPLGMYPQTSAFLNISLCYSQLKNFPRANEFLKKGLNACRPPCQGTFAFEALRTCGVFHFHKGTLDSAEAYYLRSYSLAKRLGHQRNQLIAVFDLAEIYFQRNQISQVIKYLSEAESVMRDSPFRHELVALYSSFISLYKKRGDVKKMTSYQDKYIQLTDSIYGQRLTNNLMKIESEYLERGNKAKIAEQQQLLALKDLVIRRQNALKILIGVITLLLIALLYILYRSHRQRKSTNRLLDLKVKERTAALESSHFALKQSFEKEDRILTDAFVDIRKSTTVIKELSRLGLMLDDVSDVDCRKCLQEILTVTGSVSLALNDIYADKKK